MDLHVISTYIVYVIIPYIVWVHKSLHDKMDRIEVERLIDLKLIEIRTVQNYQKELLLELRDDIRRLYTLIETNIVGGHQK